MAAGGKINTVYTKHGSNTGKRIMLAVAQQTAAALKTKMTSSSGVAPIFPIAGSDGGATPLWSEYSFQYYGTSFLIHLDKKYEKLASGGTDGYGIDAGLTKASTCTCRPTDISHIPVELVKSGFRIISAEGTKIKLAVTKAGLHELSLFSVGGRLISTRKVNCSVGTNSIEVGVLAQGAYMIRIDGISGKVSNYCMLGSR